MEFIIPTYPEDLEVVQPGSRFYVKRVDDFESPDADPTAAIDGALLVCVFLLPLS